MPDWAPTPDRVAAMMRSRTQAAATISSPSGDEVGAFTASTRPTLSEVTELICSACDELGALFAGRSPCTAQLARAAGTAAAYRVCMSIEAGYHAEVSRGEGSAFEAWSRMWDRASASVAEAITATCPLDDVPGDDGGSLGPIGVVPRRCLIGPEGRVAW